MYDQLISRAMQIKVTQGPSVREALLVNNNNHSSNHSNNHNSNLNRNKRLCHPYSKLYLSLSLHQLQFTNLLGQYS